jgi:flagellar operon protein
MDIDERRFLSIGQIQGQIQSGNATSKIDKSKNLPTGENSFASILNKVQESADNNISLGELRFSKHAINRLQNRNISLSDEQMERLVNGKNEAGEKGIKDSLILVDQLAFIVNVPNNTVVTAMDQTENKNNVFTNIDGAVIA